MRVDSVCTANGDDAVGVARHASGSAAGDFDAVAGRAVVSADEVRVPVRRSGISNAIARACIKV